MALETNNMQVSVHDPYNSKECFQNNAKQRMKDRNLSEKTSKYIWQRCEDLRKGRNLTGNKKGKPRSFRYINTHQQKLIRLAMLVEERYNKSFVDVTDKEILDIFDDMKNNKIKKLRQKNGTELYTAVDNFAVHFKAFWHWYMKYSKKEEDRAVEDITEDLDISNDREPEFVYFTLDSLKQLANEAKYEYRVMMYFLFDSGMRVTEMLNIRKSDFSIEPKSNKLQVEIRNETSKTFGRKIKLMLCSDIVQEYLKKKDFKKADYVFTIARPFHINEYLKRLALRVWGEGYEKLDENKSSKTLSMYDFRHSSACYWLPRYQSESVLKWRFGWKNSQMIHYYTKFLGMRDTISEDDMLIDTTKTELEKELEQQRQKTDIIQEQYAALQGQMQSLREQVIAEVLHDLKSRL